MFIRQLLLGKRSRANVDKITAMVVEDHDRLVELMVCFFSDESDVAQRAAQVVGEVGRLEPHWLLRWATGIVHVIEDPIHQSLRRAGVRYFSELAEPISDELEVRLIELCSDFVADEKTEVAIGAYAMQFVADRADKFPKYAEKLCRDLEKRIPDASPGFRNRGNKILAKLNTGDFETA